MYSIDEACHLLARKAHLYITKDISLVKGVVLRNPQRYS